MGPGKVCAIAPRQRVTTYGPMLNLGIGIQHCLSRIFAENRKVERHADDNYQVTFRRD